MATLLRELRMAFLPTLRRFAYAGEMVISAMSAEIFEALTRGGRIAKARQNAQDSFQINKTMRQV
jgi:hypothetical protein